MKTFIVDSFTDTAFKGNPAGVCFPKEEISAAEMLLIAKELNLSETAFVKKKGDGNYSIRFFSPLMEIPLCGHATLASAKVLLESKSLTQVIFITVQNIELNVKQSGDEIVMEFPIYDLIPETAPDLLLQALGVSKVLDCMYNKETNILVLEVEEAQELKALNPDFDKLKKSHSSINGVLVTAKANDEYDFHSRYFWPWSGSNEDPVTGGTHTFLSKYWSKKLNKTKLKSFQSSQRSGYMHLDLINDHKVLIKSKAVIIFQGEIYT